MMNSERASRLRDGFGSHALHRWFTVAGALGAAWAMGCGGGSDRTSVTPPGSGGSGGTGGSAGEVAAAGTGAGGTGGSATPAPEAGSAILLVGQVYSPEAYNTYVGIFADVPEGDVDFASFREFGNANAYTHAGYVFVEEEGIMQRFSVDENRQLVDGPRFSWQDFGIASINASYTVFATDERAYTFAPELGVVVVWNPQTMLLTGTLPIDLPERPAGMETFAYDGHLVGDKVIWNVFSGNWDSITPYSAVTLAIADAHSDAPVRIIEDSRCLPGGPAYVDDNGDYYVHGGAYYGYFLAYGDLPDARTCVLRVNAGEDQLDPGFQLDYQTLMGSPVSEPWFRVTGNQFIARAWNPALTYPENPDDFWDNAALQPLLVDTATGTSAPYPSLAGAKAIDGTMRELDGVSYYQLSQTGYTENGNTDVVELHPDGIRKKFHLDGFLLGLERVR